MSDDRFDIIVIGAGPGGYIAALKAAQLGAKVAVVERGHLGGACLNVGCIPSKALLASAELLHHIHHADRLGVRVGPASFDWGAIQDRKDKVIAAQRAGVKALLRSRQVEHVTGTAKLDGKGKVAVTSPTGSRLLMAPKVIIAAGSVPAQIPGWPRDPSLVCTSDEALHWPTLPKSLLIVGGGVIGCEFACMMASYGVRVTVVEMMPSLLPEMEPQLGAALLAAFGSRGIDVRTGTKVDDLAIAGAGVRATIAGAAMDFDRVLVATGRRPATAELGLQSLGISADRGFVRVNDRMETPVKGYYCIGDANGRCLLAHAASAHGVVAALNATGKTASFTRPVPSAVYTFPEIAAVGMTTRQAMAAGEAVAVGTFPLAHLGKAQAVGAADGFVKVVRRRGDGVLLGVHMVGHNVTEVIASATALLGEKASAHDVARTVFAHPTISEAFKEAAEDSLLEGLHLPPRKLVQLRATTDA
jgi:dihydrolipoamide dehydrogenase